MSRHRSSFAIAAFEAGWYIVISQANRIEPVLKCSNATIMLERSTIPNSFQGRNLIIAGAFVRFKRIAWVGANSHLHHVESRSEEHTSELQSQSNLVCPLL